MSSNAVSPALFHPKTQEVKRVQTLPNLTNSRKTIRQQAVGNNFVVEDLEAIQATNEAMDATRAMFSDGNPAIDDKNREGGGFTEAFADENGNLGLHMQKSKEMSERQNPNKFPQTKKGCVLSPLSPFRIRWDIATLLMLSYVALVTPYELGFLGEEWARNKGSNYWTLFSINRLVDIFFIADLGLNFLTGFYEEYRGVWVVDLKGIAMGYAKRWLFIDFVSCVPYDLIAMGAENGTCLPFPTALIHRSTPHAKKN
jgi:hypothetical protein